MCIVLHFHIHVRRNSHENPRFCKIMHTAPNGTNLSDCAPRGQNMPAQGKALGIMDLCNQSPEGATHPLHPRSILRERDSTRTLFPQLDRKP
jgi:hypothetical protein